MEHERLNTGESEKILESEIAKDILPYLTLTELSEDEKENILQLADEQYSQIGFNGFKYDMMGKFDNLSMIEGEIAEAANESAAWENRNVPPKLQEARKLFCAYLLGSINADGQPDTAKWDVYDTFFGMSPDIASYSGGVESCLELLTISERTGQNPCSREIYDEIIYTASFSNYNAFDDILEGASSYKQLRLLPIYSKLAERCEYSSYAYRAQKKIFSSMEKLINDKKTCPLAKAVAKSMFEFRKKMSESEFVTIEEGSPEYEEVERRQQKYKKNQELLHRNFPSLPENQPLTIIAPGVAAAHSSGVFINQIADKDGNTTSLLKYSEDNPFGMNAGAFFLIGAAHNPGVEKVIDSELGVNLKDISLDAQIQLLKYMKNSNDSKYNTLCKTLKNTKEGARLKLAEMFLAADFGEDFGDSLLMIANSTRLDDKEKEKIFDSISSCRESIKSITGLYDHIDGEFAKEYARAANERLTDALTVFSEIAKKGYAEADLGWAGRPRFSYETALEALEYERKSLEIVSDTFDDVIKCKDGTYAKIVLHPDEEFQRLNRTIYDLYSPNHGHVMIYTRADGSHSFDPDVEYGKIGSRYNINSKNTGVEASISMIVDPVDPFSMINPYKPDKRAIKNPNYYDESTMNKVSTIRLDREGRKLGWAADHPERDPANPFGIVSVDLAAIGDRADTPSGKIARLMAVGNSIRASRMGNETSLNHNTNWFNQAKYGTSDGFKKIVDRLDRSLRQLVEIRQPRDRLQKMGSIAKAVEADDDSAA